MSSHVTKNLKCVTSQLVPARALHVPTFPAFATRDSSPTHKLVCICVASFLSCRQSSATRRVAHPSACMAACICIARCAGGAAKRHHGQRPIFPAHTLSPGRGPPAAALSTAHYGWQVTTSPSAYTAPSRYRHARHNLPLTSLAPSELITYETPLISVARAVQA